jgi:hypothetical protein
MPTPKSAFRSAFAHGRLWSAFAFLRRFSGLLRIGMRRLRICLGPGPKTRAVVEPSAIPPQQALSRAAHGRISAGASNETACACPPSLRAPTSTDMSVSQGHLVAGAQYPCSPLRLQCEHETQPAGPWFQGKDMHVSKERRGGKLPRPIVVHAVASRHEHVTR